MTAATFHPARLQGSATIPPSKSEAHRALLLAALGRGPCRLHGFSSALCQDTQAMIRGITAMGARVTAEGEVLRVEAAPPPKAGETARSFDVGACAAALRMLIPAFWARGQAVRITMAEALFSRPLDAFDPVAGRMGGGLKRIPARAGAPAAVEINGKMDAGTYTVDGSLSSQFASGMLMALAHATDEGGNPAASRLMLSQPVVSRPYVDMTLGIMARFGIAVQETDQEGFTLAPAGVKSPKDVHVQGDWSQAAALFCANALGSGVMVKGLSLPKAGHKPLQGDAAILSIVKQMGLLIYESREEIYATSPSRAGLLPLSVDCAHWIDLAPLLALTLSQAQGVSTLTGVRRLAVKECDRLQATRDILTKLGVKVSLSKDLDTLSVEGKATLRGGFAADAQGDHRMVILLAIAALGADAPITVTGVEHVAKSWPDFLKTYQSLGGVVS